MPELVTKTRYAAMRGVSKAYISKAKVKAMLEPAMEVDPADGKLKLNVEKADAFFEKNRDPSRYFGKSKKEDKASAGQIIPQGESFEDLKRARELIKREHDELNLAERKGLLLLKADVERACAVAGQTIREHLQSRNKRVAEKAASMKDGRAIKSMLDEDDRVMLVSVMDDLERRLFPDREEGEERTTH